MQEQWKWDERKNNPAFVKFFNNMIPGKVLAIIRQSQVSYTEFDRALADSSLLGKIGITQFGNFGISQQATYIQQWKNLFAQMKYYSDRDGWFKGKWKVLTDDLKDFAHVVEGDPWDYEVRSQVKVLLEKTGFALLSEIMAVSIWVGGLNLVDLALGTVLGPVPRLIGSAIYAKTISKNSPIPILSFAFRMALFVLSMAFNTKPDDKDGFWEELMKGLVRNMGQTPQEYYRFNKNKYSAPDKIIEQSYWQEVSSMVTENIPGFGGNTLIKALSEVIIASIYGSNINEFTYSAIKSRLPFTNTGESINKSLGYPIPLFYGRTKLDTYKNIDRQIKKEKDVFKRLKLKEIKRNL